MPDLLLEIGCEEIPARMIDAASEDLRLRVSALLARERIPAREITSFETPRRLAVLATGLAAAQAEVAEQITGPPLAKAFQDGHPTPAAQAFAKKAGVEVSQLEKVSTPRGEYLAARIVRPGRSAADILIEQLPGEIAQIHWPKNMYWRASRERFVRPVRWLVAMLDGDVIPLQFAGVQAGKTSRGHRILADKPVPIASPGESYVNALRAAMVLGRAEREQQIRKALDAATRAVPGARWREDRDLLDTVVNLTEWPAAVLGNFAPEFLELPEEILVTVMRDHQKYFAVQDDAGRLLPHFLAVLNTGADPLGTIQHGHERVLRARFNDARFFWLTDQKHPLRERTAWLKQVTFQKDLGNYYEKTLRVQRLCSWLCEIIREGGVSVRPGVVHKAAYLAKTDLTTELVKEFTELQGIVGGLYARVQELDPDLPEPTRQLIAQTIYDHYRPESVDDPVPRTVEGSVLSIGDKADTIAGMFALGLQPTGSKDPFALRRQANGIVRTIAEQKLPLRLSQVFAYAREAYRDSLPEKKFSDASAFSSSLRTFLRERLEFYLRDVLGYKYDVVNAVLAAGGDDVVDAVARAEAVTRVRPSEDFESISVAFRRIKNILRQADEAKKEIAATVDSSLLREPGEQTLASLLPQTAGLVEKLRQQRSYDPALTEISRLRPAVDSFFDKVMVMVDDPRVRANRLALLRTLLKEFSTIADFSEIVTEGKTSE